MKRTLLTLFCVVVGYSVTFLAGCGSSEQTEEEKAQRSVESSIAAEPEPLSPWTIDPVPVESMYLVMPLVNEEGIVKESGLNLSRNIQDVMIGCLSRDMGLMRWSYMVGVLERITPYSPNGEYKLTDEAVQDLVKLVQPTHIIRGLYSVSDGNCKASVTIEHGDEKWEEVFEFKEGNVIEFGHDVIVWMSESGALKVGDNGGKPIGLYPYGENVKAFEGELYDAMSTNPNHEEWDRLADHHGENSYHGYYRLYAAITAKDRDMVGELIPASLDETASFHELLSRIVGLNYLKKKQESVHGREMMMALYPGIFGQANFYIHNTFPENQRRESYTDVVEQWYGRVKQFPVAKMYRGEACSEATFSYRGTDTADKVSGNSWAKTGEYSTNGMMDYMEAVKTGIYDPYVIGRMISLNETLGGGSFDSKEMVDITMQKYPDATYPMTCLLNYTMPRWGGSIESGMQMIDKAMADRPDNHAFGKFAVRFHEIEAHLYSEYTNRKYIEDYFKRFPERKYQYEESFERLTAKESPDYLVAYGLSVAAMLGDQDLVQKALIEHPGVIKSLNVNTAYTDWLGKTRYHVVYGCLVLGQWDELKELIEVICSEDQIFQDQIETFCITFHDRLRYALAYEGMALAMTGEFEKGVKKLESLKPHEDRLTWLPYVRAHHNCMTEADFEALLKYQEHEPQSTHPYYIRALYDLKQGKREEALKEVEAAKELTGDPWVVLNEEVEELLKKSEAVQSHR